MSFVCICALCSALPSWLLFLEVWAFLSFFLSSFSPVALTLYSRREYCHLLSCSLAYLFFKQNSTDFQIIAYKRQHYSSVTWLYFLLLNFTRLVVIFSMKLKDLSSNFNVCQHVAYNTWYVKNFCCLHFLNLFFNFFHFY